MKLQDNGGGGFQPAPEGTHEAVCIAVIDLGTRKNDYNGDISFKHEIVITWELVLCPMSDGRPFVQSQFYTASLNEKSNLRRDLESWRGRAFTREELNGFEASNLLGKPCIISIGLGKSGKPKVMAVMAAPKGLQIPKPVNPLVHFSMQRDQYKREMFDKLSPGFQRMVQESPEWAELQGKAPISSPEEGNLEDVPF